MVSGPGQQDKSRAPDFFISRAGSDAAFAEKIGSILENDGFNVVLQQWDFGNQSFMNAIHVALQCGARVISLLSQEYMKSPYCAAEWQSTLAHDPLNKKQKLIIYRVIDCIPTGLLSAIPYIDLVPIRHDASLVRDVVLGSIRSDVTRGQGLTALQYWREPITILHPEIRKVPRFLGRKIQLEHIGMALWPSANVHSPRPIAIQGIGGVGKSSLAREYAWGNRERYSGIWWVNAETVDSVIKGLLTLGDQFVTGIREAQDEQLAAHKSLLFLANAGFDKPWLVIYDNAEAPDTLREFLPSLGVHFLITSRWADWCDYADELIVDVLAPNDAVEFLCVRSDRQGSDGARLLGEAVGYLPLALDHAGAYCRRVGCSFAEYREQLGDVIRTAPRGTGYPVSVYATFSLSIGKLADEVPYSRQLIEVLSLIAPEDIERKMLNCGDIEQNEIDKAIMALSEVSLIQIDSLDQDNTTISIHRLIQEVVRQGIDTQEWSPSWRMAVRGVFRSLPEDPRDAKNWPTYRRLSPHILALMQHGPVFPDEEDAKNLKEASSADMIEVGTLLYRYAAYRLSSSGYTNLEEFILSRATAILLKSDTENGDVVASLRDMAYLYLASNRYKEAEELFKFAIEASKRTGADNLLILCLCLNDYGKFLLLMGRNNEAERYILGAHQIAEKELGKRRKELVPFLDSMAWWFQTAGRPAMARLLILEALHICEDSYGVRTPQVATRLTRLAKFLAAAGRFKEAEEHCVRAEAICRSLFGAENSRTKVASINLRAVRSMIQGAKECFIQDLDEPFYGELNVKFDHPKKGFWARLLSRN